MFKSAQVGTALLFLSQEAKASKISYRPLTGTAPWSKSGEESTGPSWLVPTWPVNYSVPNFGVDSDIINTQAHIGASEGLHKKTLSGDYFEKSAPPKRDYFVPNFGVDKDIKLTDLNIKEAEAQHGRQILVEDKPEIKRDYRVVNFGQDREILANDESLSQAEGKLGMKFDASSLAQPNDIKRGYFVPNFGQDREITESLANTEKTEAQLNHVWNLVQLESDPITDSTGETTQYLHPDGAKKIKMNYSVPNFGEDQEMLDQKKNLADTETQMGHVFTPKESDAAKPYTVPNFGVDFDIKDA